MNEGMWNDNPLDPWTEEEEHLSKMGVISFGKGGGGQPAHTTQQTTSEYPTELKPFIKDIFGKAKGIEEARTEAGYQAYPAPRIAGFTPDQEAAFTGIREAQGLSTPFYGGATALTQRATRDFTPQLTQQYMSPYAQNVIDIEQRELGRRGDVERQRIGAQAVGAGGFGGSRQAILEAEQMRNQGQQAADIQTKGLQSAFQSAQQAIAQQRQADLAGAGQMAQLGSQVPGQRFKELGALAGLGAAEQTQRQRALDLGYQQFKDEYNYPMQTLQDYSSVLRGFPLQASQNINKVAYSPVAPLSSQLLGAGSGAVGMAGMAGLFGASGGHVAKLQQGGLASMYAPSNRVRFGKTNYQDGEEEGPVGWRESPLNKLLSEFQPSNIMETIYSIGALPIQGAGWLAGQDWDPKWGELTERIIGEEATTQMKEAEPRLRLPGSTVENEMIAEAIAQEEAEKDKKKAEEDAKKAAKEEAKKKVEDEIAAKDAERIERKERIAKWAPWLAGARGIAESETPLGALLGIGETYGKSELSIDAAKDAETARRAGIRSAALADAETLSKIIQNTSGQEQLTAMATLSESPYLTEEQGLFLQNKAQELLQTSSGHQTLMLEQIIGNITPGLLTAPDPDPDVAGNKLVEVLKGLEGEQLEELKAFLKTKKTGGRVKLKKGGTPPIRSFDFVERDGKIIATPK